VPLPSFEIKDELAFSENLKKFGEALNSLDAKLGPALLKEIESFADAGAFDRDAVLHRLFAALKDEPL